jgi:DNA helicase-2/ATP-dependent DNA helicase PcrA
MTAFPVSEGGVIGGTLADMQSTFSLFGTIDPLLEGLNDTQADAVATLEGPVQVIASAGSGKTTVLTRRLANLLRSGVQPEHILAVTFTKKAADEMVARLKKLVGNKTIVERMTIGTYHSICLGLLNGNYEHLGFTGKPSLLLDGRAQGVINSLLADTWLTTETALAWIGWCKSWGWLPQHLNEERARMAGIPQECLASFVEVYKGYMAYCRQNNLMDFDDQLLYTMHMLHHVPEVRDAVQQRYQHVLVDEFQDTNPVQWAITRQIAAPHDNMFVVGDDAQAIYQFRGADITGILNFVRDYPQAKRIALETNYRSLSPIIELGNKLIRHNLQQIPKNVRAHHDQAPNDAVTWWECEDSSEETHLMQKEIRSLIHNGMPPQEIAVLYRSHTQAHVIEDELAAAKIPYTIKKQNNFYEMPEILDTLAYLQLIRGEVMDQAPAADRIFRAEGLSKTTSELLRKEAISQKLPLLDVCMQVDSLPLHPAQKGTLQRLLTRLFRWQKQARTMRVADLLQTVWQDAGVIAKYEKMATESAHMAIQSLNILHDQAQKWGSTTISKFFDDIEMHQRKRQLAQKPKAAVQLMTIHAAKGLEFDAVFLVGLEEDLLPYKKSVQAGDVSEERRLCYVAITRARKRLYLSRVMTRSRFGKPYKPAPSRFWNEMLGLTEVPTARDVEPLLPTAAR